MKRLDCLGRGMQARGGDQLGPRGHKGGRELGPQTPEGAHRLVPFILQFCGHCSPSTLTIPRVKKALEALILRLVSHSDPGTRWC